MNGQQNIKSGHKKLEISKKQKLCSADNLPLYIALVNLETISLYAFFLTTAQQPKSVKASSLFRTSAHILYAFKCIYIYIGFYTHVCFTMDKLLISHYYKNIYNFDNFKQNYTRKINN